jgi:hypothetical protein
MGMMVGSPLATRAGAGIEFEATAHEPLEAADDEWQVRAEVAKRSGQFVAVEAETRLFWHGRGRVRRITPFDRWVDGWLSH